MEAGAAGAPLPWKGRRSLRTLSRAAQKTEGGGQSKLENNHTTLGKDRDDMLKSGSAGRMEGGGAGRRSDEIWGDGVCAAGPTMAVVGGGGSETDATEKPSGGGAEKSCEVANEVEARAVTSA